MKSSMEAKRVAISDIKHDDDNARVHDPRQIEAISRSLTAFGQRRPIVIDETGTVIAGNGTLEAARALGWTQIDVVVTPFDTPEERRAYAIADNRTGNLAEWSQEALVAALRGAGEEQVAATGFSAGEYDAIRAALTAAANEPGEAEAKQSGYKRADSANEVYDRYLAATERNIVLEYPMPRYIALLDRWDAYRERHGLADNNAALLHMLAVETGTEAPR